MSSVSFSIAPGLISPQPYNGSFPLSPTSLAVVARQYKISVQVPLDLQAERYRAKTPATNGAAILVPDIVAYPLFSHVEVMFSPGAATTTGSPRQENSQQ